ncbi:MAG: MerC domain-containing protein [Proteobacteria bacterium]|nr:MerC domain-containing protein [Pseudomonadota bacterium]
MLDRPTRKLDGAALDRVGATGSLLCAVHCAALPLLLAIAPAIGVGLANHDFEIGFVAFASLLGLTSLLLGYRRHRHSRALVLLLPGIVLLCLGVAVEGTHDRVIAHALLMACGGSLVATAHWLNLRIGKRHAGACDALACAGEA